MRTTTLPILLALLSAYLPAVADDQRVENVPMYGQPATARSEESKKADEEFVKEAVARLGTREAASKALYLQGEEYLQKRNLDLAMQRYNRSWLLNPNNYQPYWGFGRVMLERGRFEHAAQYLEKARSLVDDEYQKAALLADLGTAYSVRAESVLKADSIEAQRLFALANRSFSDAVAVDPKYGNGWRRWAMSLYEQGDYRQAWEKVKVARAQNARPFPPAFIRALQEKLPEPR